MRLSSFAVRTLALGLVCCLAVGTLAQSAAGATLTFEDLTLGQSYDLNAGTPANPGSFVTGGVTVQLGTFFLLPSGSTTGGQVGVFDSVASPFTTAGGTGNYLFVGNIGMDFDFGTTVSQVSFLFGSFGGNLNLDVNGSLQNVTSFTLLPATVGGATVTYEALGSTVSGPLAKLTLTGNIDSFSVGGQEFSVDSVEYIPVPEPATFGLGLMGLAGGVAARYRSRRKRAM